MKIPSIKEILALIQDWRSDIQPEKNPANEKLKLVRPLWLAIAFFIFLFFVAFLNYFWIPVSHEIGNLNSDISAISSEDVAHRHDAHKKADRRAKEKNFHPPMIRKANTKNPAVEYSEKDTENSDQFFTESNLTTQEGMWKTATLLLKITFWQLGFFIASIFLSMAGLVALYYTLKATREANKTSVIVAERVNRAWCLCLIHKTAITERDCLNFSYRVVNEGLTHARDISVSFVIVPPFPNREGIDMESIVSLFNGSETNQGVEISCLTSQEVGPIAPILTTYPKVSNKYDIIRKGFFFSSLTKGFTQTFDSSHLVAVKVSYKTAFSDDERVSTSIYKLGTFGESYKFTITEMKQFRTLN